MKRFLPLFAALFVVSQLTAGGIRGYIRNAEGDPLEFATIYISENGSGTVTNVEGYYEIRLDPGDYNVVFQFLGYQSYTERVSVGNSFRDVDVRLSEQVLELTTVEVVDGAENPAYTIMRKAIAKADFHRQQLDYYSAQVYIKGSGRLVDVPGLFRRAIEKEGIDSTMAFTSESVSIIEYERPHTFRERVVSIYSQGEDNGSSPNSYINGSFYEPEIGQAISPLSPKAFGYYKFELEGFFHDRGYGINKIKVIPRSRGDNVFEGYIYIVDDMWSIYSLDLTSYVLGIQFDVAQIYAPIKEQVWLPVSHQFDVNGRFFGFQFEYTYLATVSDYDVRINPDLDVDFTVIDEKINRDLARTAEARREDRSELAGIEEKLETGDELSRRELLRLMREYEKDEREELEEPEIVEVHTYEVDSMATKRDSTYWAIVRPIPLTNYEVRGYKVQDSIATVEAQEAEDRANGVRNSGGRDFPYWDIITGRSFKLSEGSYFHYDGLNNAGFNPVEGIWLASRLRYTYRNEDQRFRLAFTPRYGFSWDRLVWRTDAEYRFGPSHSRSTVSLGGGRYVSQYNDPNGVSELFNTFYSLLSERNFLRIYEKEFLGARWRKRWRSSARLDIQAEWAQRRTVENTTRQVWFGRDDRSYGTNVPFSEEGNYPLPALERAATLQLGFQVRPWQRYRLRNGVRQPVSDESPTLRLDYRIGLPDINESVTDYQRLGLTYRHAFFPGARGKVDLKLHLGLFLTDDYVGMADFQHFPGNQMIFTTTDPVGAFRLLPYYQFSTPDKWVAAHAHYQFRKFLLTQIWEVNMLGIKENVFANYLYTPESDHYTEIGYGIDNIFRVLRIEGAMAFRDGKYYDWGIRIGVASNILGGFGEVNVEFDED